MKGQAGEAPGRHECEKIRVGGCNTESVSRLMAGANREHASE